MNILFSSKVKKILKDFINICFKHFIILILSAIYIFIPSRDIQADDIQRKVQKADSPMESVTLQLRWYHQFQFAGYYAAKEKGYYRETGLNVSIKQGNPRKNTLKEVTEGRADFGVSNSGILLHRLKGEPVKVLAVIFQHSPLVFMTVQTSGILHPQDMTGRRIGLSKSSRDAELLAMLVNEGISADQIYPPVGGKYKNSMYYDGSADAASAYITNEPYYLEQKGIPYHIIKPITYGIDFYGDTLFTSEKEIKQHPERVSKFRAASLKGWEYAMKNKEELVDIIINKYASKKSREHLLYEAEKMQKLILPKLVEIGHMNPGRWHHIAKTFIKLKMTKPEYSLEGFMYNPENGKQFEKLVYTISAVCLTAGAGMFLLLLLNRKLRHDIEKRKQIEEKLRFHAMILEQIKDAIVATDLNGQITYVNESAAMSIQRKPEEIINQSVHIFGKGDPSGISQDEIIRHTLKYGKWHGKVENISANGDKYLMETRTWKVYDIKGNPNGMIGVSTDLTDILKAKEEAEKANNAKSEFLANMSHEIRTPLNSVLGFSEILLNMVTDAKQKNFLEKIHSSGKTLLSLINDILDLSKIEAGKLDINIEPMDIRDIFLDMENMFQDKFQHKKIEFITEISQDFPVSLYLDKLRIRQIFINLVGNALKFTENGKVSLRASLSKIKEHETGKNDKSNIVFEVEDTGMGISKDQQEIIFESFCQQKGQYNKRHGGTGLGLTISKRLTEMLDGKIIVESEPEKGSIFRLIFTDLEINNKISIEKSKPVEDNIHIQFEPASILIVEDIASNRELLKEHLSCFPFSVNIAESGEHALEILKADHKIDLILADIVMPGMDGYTLNRMIKNNNNLKHIPVIAVTASAFKKDIDKLRKNFEGYIAKPFDRFKLIAELTGFLPYKTEKKDIEIQILEKEKQEEALSEETLKNIPEVLLIIEKDFVPRHSNITGMFFIDDVNDFALDLIGLAEKYNINFLKVYGIKLNNAGRNIDVDEIEKHIEFFPEIVERLKKMLVV